MDEELKNIREGKMKKMMERSNGMETEIEVSKDNFQERVVKQSSNVPVVVDFWAPWCAPCLRLAPTMEKLAREYEGKFILAKVNLDDNREMALKYGIMSIPTVKMFKNGEVVNEFMGAQSEPAVREWLNKNLESE